MGSSTRASTLPLKRAPESPLANPNRDDPSSRTSAPSVDVSRMPPAADSTVEGVMSRSVAAVSAALVCESSLCSTATVVIGSCRLS